MFVANKHNQSNSNHRVNRMHEQAGNMACLEFKPSMPYKTGGISATRPALFKQSHIARTAPHNFHTAIAHVDDAGRFGAAPAAVNHQFDAVFKAGADVVGVGQGFAVFGQNQGAGKQGFAEFFDECLCDAVVWHAQTDGFALGMQRATGHFFGGGQDEGVCPWCSGFEQAELAVIDFGVSAQFGKVGAHECEMVFGVHAADGLQPFHGGFVAHLATECVAGVGGIGDDAALSHDVGGLFDESLLWVVGVDGETLCHDVGFLKWEICEVAEWYTRWLCRHCIAHGFAGASGGLWRIIGMKNSNDIND